MSCADERVGVQVCHRPHWFDALDDEDDHVPPDAPLTTKEGWRRFVDYQPQPPALLAADQLRALSRRERADYDDARRDYHSDLPLVNTPTIRKVVGTSRLLVQLGRTHERHIRKRHPGNRNRLPVLYVTVPPAATARMHLAGALLELRDPPPVWEAFRHNPQIGCPRCDARHPGGPVFRIFPHHRYICTRHRHWIGPSDINRPGPPLDDFPEIVAAQRRHLRLVRRHGWAATYDAVLTGFMICAHLRENGLNVALEPGNAPLGHVLKRAIWTMRTMIFIPPGTEQKTFTKAGRGRHDKAILWFARKRRPGSVILHHRTVHPVVIREWSIPMEEYEGAIYQSQRTTLRFWTPSPETAT